MTLWNSKLPTIPRNVITMIGFVMIDIETCKTGRFRAQEITNKAYRLFAPDCYDGKLKNVIIHTKA